MNKKILDIFAKLISCLIAILVWQITAINVNQKILIVTPVMVMKRLTTIWEVQNFWTSIYFTVQRIAIGYILGLLLGIFLAILSARFRFIKTLLWPWMAIIKSVPVASFVIICLIWLTAKNLSVFISFLIVLPIIYHNILTGLLSLDEKMTQMSRIFKISCYKKIRYIILPQLAPFIYTACSLTVGMAWKAGVAAEIIGTPDGSIGQQLYYAKIFLDTDDLLAWTVIIVMISVISEKIFLVILKWILSVDIRYGTE